MVCLVLIFPFYNLISMVSIREYSAESNNIDTSLLDNLDSISLNTVKRRIDNLLEAKRVEEEAKKKEEEHLEKYNNTMNALANGKTSFRVLFSDTLIVGDSLMQALAMSDALDSSNVISMVSASLFHLEENIGNIVANSPRNLVLHYGINMLEENEEQMNWYISMYEDLLKEIRKQLPDTKIYISSIFMLLDETKFHRSWIEKYNNELKKLSEKLNVIYLDNTELLPGDGSYYGTDGIHVQKTFYTEKWLPHLYFYLSK